MNHDDDQDLDCADCMIHLYEYVDGELTPEMAKAISAHLAECGECQPQFKFEQAFLDFLAARPTLASAPQELRERIVRSILAGGKDADA